MADGRELAIDAQFPGGNIVVEKIEGDVVTLHRDLRDTEGDWFYWCFRARGGAGRKLTFNFTQPRGVFTAAGPAVSLDEGKTWAWLGPEVAKDTSFTWTIPSDAAEARFSMSMPYVQAHLDAFLERHRANPSLSRETLCRTPKGREVEMLRLGKLDGAAPRRGTFTCRHHACEMMANYVLEGVIEAVLAGDATGRWFRRNAELLIVPFVDKDGVEDGDQGKNRRPRDHGRDYAGASLYAETRALRKLLPEWAKGRLDFAVDLHCPWISGEHNEEIYQVGADDPEAWRQQRRLAEILHDAQRGPLRYDPADDLPFGVAWNQGSSYEGGRNFTPWARQELSPRLATSFEFPYAVHHAQTVTPAGARAFGADLALALRLYLEPRKEDEP